MTVEVIATQLTLALEHLSKGDLAAMHEALKVQAFRDAMVALKGNPDSVAQGVHSGAQEIVHMLGHVNTPTEAEHMKEVAAGALKEFATIAKGSADQVGRAMASTLSQLDKGLHAFDDLRKAQAVAFTAGEAAHFEKVGSVRYAIDLIKRRWLGLGDILPVGAKEVVEHAHDHAGHVHGPACAHGHHHPPAPKLTDIVKNPNALEEFGEVKMLKSAGQKLAVGAGAAVGLGLVVHGASNVLGAFSQPHDPALELDAHTPEQHNGTNLTQLCVGLAEAAAGAVLAYRVLTGRTGFRKPVDGKVASLMEGCSHGTAAVSHL